jgi:hypothetical protein
MQVPGSDLHADHAPLELTELQCWSWLARIWLSILHAPLELPELQCWAHAAYSTRLRSSSYLDNTTHKDNRGRLLRSSPMRFLISKVFQFASVKFSFLSQSYKKISSWAFESIVRGVVDRFDSVCLETKPKGLCVRRLAVSMRGQEPVVGARAVWLICVMPSRWMMSTPHITAAEPHPCPCSTFAACNIGSSGSSCLRRYQMRCRQRAVFGGRGMQLCFTNSSLSREKAGEQGIVE